MDQEIEAILKKKRKDLTHTEQEKLLHAQTRTFVATVAYLIGDHKRNPRIFDRIDEVAISVALAIAADCPTCGQNSKEIDGTNEYTPDSVSDPGETLREVVAKSRLKCDDFAQMAGLSAEKLLEIICGRRSITWTIASGLERASGVPVSFWISRQRSYDEFEVRRAKLG